MPLNLYSSATTDSLLAAKLSDAPSDGSTYGRNNGAWAIVTGSGLTISDLSNAATSTLNAGVPTAGQALTYDGTDLIWATVGGGGAYLPLTGGTVTGEIIVDESSTSGYVATYKGAGMFSPGNAAYVSFEETLVYGLNVELPGGGSITFGDSTVQTTAAVAGTNLGDIFAIAKVKGVVFTGSYPAPGQWTITFEPVSSYIAGGATVYVENGDASISQDAKAAVSTTADWTYVTTYDTFAGDENLYIRFNGIKGTIPINYP